MSNKGIQGFSLMVPLLVLALLGSASLSAAELPHITEILDVLDQSSQVASARNSYDRAARNLRDMGYAGDVKVSIDPGWQLSRDLATPDYVQTISGNLALEIPLGISVSSRDGILAAQQELELQAILLEHAYERAFQQLISLYADFYSRIKELPVLMLEQEAATMELAAVEALYMSGEKSFSEFLQARNGLSRAEQNLYSGRASASQTLQELQLRFPHPALIAIDNLEAIQALSDPFSEMDLPHPAAPSELGADSLVLSMHPAIVEHSFALARAQNSSPGSSIAEIALSMIRLSFTGEGHSAAAQYSPQRSSITMSYSPPDWIIGDSNSNSGSGSSSAQSSRINLSAGASLSYSFGSARQFQQEADAALIRNLEQRLGDAVLNLRLSLENTFRRYLSAELEAEAAVENLNRATDVYEIELLRQELGTSTKADAAAARASLLRAEYQVARTEIAARQALIGYLIEGNMFKGVVLP
ncbi:TolC family protein [Spirochaeta dissipatitropha]